MKKKAFYITIIITMLLIIGGAFTVRAINNGDIIIYLPIILKDNPPIRPTITPLPTRPPAKTGTPFVKVDESIAVINQAKIYLPVILGNVSFSPTIFIFNKNEVVIHYQNVPSEYEGSNGLIWLQRVADPWNQEITLYWVGKVGNLGVWKGIIPQVPVAGYYYLKNGLIFYNGYGNPAYIPDSEYTVLYP